MTPSRSGFTFAALGMVFLAGRSAFAWPNIGAVISNPTSIQTNSYPVVLTIYDADPAHAFDGDAQVYFGTNNPNTSTPNGCWGLLQPIRSSTYPNDGIYNNGNPVPIGYDATHSTLTGNQINITIPPICYQNGGTFYVAVYNTSWQQYSQNPQIIVVNKGPSVTLKNLTHQGSDTSFLVTDTWQIDVTGTAGQTVTSIGTHNGVSTGLNTMGTIQSNNHLTLTNTFNSVDFLGSWSETWYVNGVQAKPDLPNFFVTLSPPAAQAQTVAVNAGTAQAITLVGGDSNNLGLTVIYDVATLPAHGTLTGTGAAFTYQPNPGFSGTDSFTFQTYNGYLYSNPATVTLNVTNGPLAITSQWFTDANDPDQTHHITMPALAGTSKINVVWTTNFPATCALGGAIYNDNGTSHFATIPVQNGFDQSYTLLCSQVGNLANQTPQTLVHVIVAGSTNNPFGNLDAVTCSSAYGWACDADNHYADALTVQFYLDSAQGTFLGQTIANGPRESAVGAICGGNSAHGFNFTFPPIQDGRSHLIYTKILNAGSTGADQALNSSPMDTPPCVLPVPTATFTADQTITAGDAATLSWTTTGATAVAIDQGIGPVAANGSLTVSPSATTIYTLTATGPGGSLDSAPQVTITVNPPALPQINRLTNTVYQVVTSTPSGSGDFYLILWGSGFANGIQNNTVFFGSQALTPTYAGCPSNDSCQINVLVPNNAASPQAPGTALIKVQNAKGTSAPVSFTIDPAAAPETGTSRLIVKFKSTLTQLIEPELSLTTLTLSQPKTVALQTLFTNDSIASLQPLFSSLVKTKITTHQTDYQLALAVSTKYTQRSARHVGTFNPPELSRIYLATVKASSPQELQTILTTLQNDPQVEYAQPNKPYTTNLLPNDPYWDTKGSWGQSFDDLWGLKKIQADQAWDQSTGEGVLVAVVDTGFDYLDQLPDAPTLWINPQTGAPGYDFIGQSVNNPKWGPDPSDHFGHGTHVAGTIAAPGNNAVGLIGLAWKSQIMPVKVLDDKGAGDTLSIVQGLRFAADNGAQVINMSFGGLGQDPAEADAIDYAYNLGVVLVAAAGNSASDASAFTPAYMPDVITVSAFDADDKLASFSNFGKKIDVAAPGVGILSLNVPGSAIETAIKNGQLSYKLVGDNYLELDGTSMAAPHVSALAALILSQHPDYSSEQVRQILRNTADDVDASGFDTHAGYGRINASHALMTGSPLESKILTPLPKTILRGPTTINGSAQGNGFSSYRLEYMSDPNSIPWTPIKESATPIKKSTLGIFDPSALPEGPYEIRLTATDSLGATYVDQIDVQVQYVYISSPVPSAYPSAATAFKPGVAIPITGTATGGAFQRFRVEWSKGLTPADDTWSTAGLLVTNNGNSIVSNGTLATWDTTSLAATAADFYTIRLHVEDGPVVRESRTHVYLDPDLAGPFWPQYLNTLPIVPAQLVPVRQADHSLRLFTYGLQLFTSPVPAQLWFFQPNGQMDSPLTTNGLDGPPAVAQIGGLTDDSIVLGRDGGFDLLHSDGRPYKHLTNPQYGYGLGNPVTLQHLDGGQALNILADGFAPKTSDLVKKVHALNMTGAEISPQFPLDLTVAGINFYSYSLWSLAVDLDHDGRREIVVAQIDAFDQFALKVYSWDGTPRVFPASAFTGAYLISLEAADLDGSGEMDLVVYYTKKDGSHYVTVLRPDGSVKPGWPRQVPVTILSNEYMAIGDLNQDGKKDIVVSNGDTLAAFQPDGSYLPGWPVRNTNGTFSGLTLGDIDGDGYPDVVVMRYDFSANPLSNTPTFNLKAAAGSAVTIAPPPSNGPAQYTITLKNATDAGASNTPRAWYSDVRMAVFRHDATPYKSWRVQGQQNKEIMPTGVPVIGDFAGDGKTKIAVASFLATVLSENSFSAQYVSSEGMATMIDVGTPYHADKMPWPYFLHDTQNTGVAEPLDSTIEQPAGHLISTLELRDANGKRLDSPLAAGTNSVNLVADTKVPAVCFVNRSAVMVEDDPGMHHVLSLPLSDGYSNTFTVFCTDKNNSQNNELQDIPVTVNCPSGQYPDATGVCSTLTLPGFSLSVTPVKPVYHLNDVVTVAADYSADAALATDHPVVRTEVTIKYATSSTPQGALYASWFCAGTDIRHCPGTLTFVFSATYTITAVAYDNQDHVVGAAPPFETWVPDIPFVTISIQDKTGQVIAQNQINFGVVKIGDPFSVNIQGGESTTQTVQNVSVLYSFIPDAGSPAPAFTDRVLYDGPPNYTPNQFSINSSQATTGPGFYRFTAQATDNLGLKAIPATMLVYVNDQKGGVPPQLCFITTDLSGATCNSCQSDACSGVEANTLTKLVIHGQPQAPATALVNVHVKAPPYGNIADSPSGDITFDKKDGAISNGDYVATATDNRNTSGASTFTLGKSNITPTVAAITLDNPQDRTLLSAGINLKLTGMARTRHGLPRKVEILRERFPIGTATMDSQGNFNFDWSTLPAGDYQISARETDEQGVTTQSMPIAISVPGESPISGTFHWIDTHVQDLFYVETNDQIVPITVPDPDEFPEILTGSKIRVTGRFNRESFTATGPVAQKVTVESEAPLPRTQGAQSTAVLLVNFSDDTSQPMSVDTLREMVFSSVSNYYRDQSYGQTWLTGTIYDWMTLPIPKTCDIFAISEAARLAAQGKNIDLSGYQHLFFIYPPGNCPYSGIADVGGTPSRAGAVTQDLVPGVIAHELGHNFGLWHANLLHCPNHPYDPPQRTCQSVEYGDRFSVMGDGARLMMDMNAAEKETLGWLKPQAITESGTYTLNPLEFAESANKAFRIDIPYAQEPYSYILEYRQPRGLESFIYDPEAPKTLFIHLRGDPSYILPMSKSDLGLAVGATYVDPITGLRLTPLDQGPQAMTVRVEFGTPTGPPQILEQPASQNIQEGRSVTFSIRTAGPDLTFQWQRKRPNETDFSSMSGANQASYTTPTLFNTDDQLAFRCVVTNSQGTVVSALASVSVIRDSLPPVITWYSPKADGETVSGLVVVSFNVNDDNFVDYVELRVDDQKITSTEGNISHQYNFYWPTSGLRAGNHVLTITAYDGAGNWTASKKTVYLITTPTIDSVSPPFALAGAQDDIALTITGAGITLNSHILWNGQPLPAANTSIPSAPNTIKAIVAASLLQSRGAADVVLSNTPEEGGPSSVFKFNIFSENPSPLLFALNPGGAVIGGAEFDLYVFGLNFAPNSVVHWNDTALPTVFDDAQHLHARVSREAIASASAPSISVFTPSPGGGLSNSVQFHVSDSAPFPILNTVSPTQAAVGDSDVVITVSGRNLRSGQTVVWQTTPLKTSFISPSELTAVLPASLMTDPGQYLIKIVDPLIGGLESNALTFTLAPGASKIGSLSVNAIAAGAPETTITIQGKRFENNSVVLVDHQAQPTTVISPTELRVQIHAAALAQPGDASIEVITPTGHNTAGPTLMKQQITKLQVSPADVTVPYGGTQEFLASLIDQAGRPISKDIHIGLTGELKNQSLDTAAVSMKPVVPFNAFSSGASTTDTLKLSTGELRLHPGRYTVVITGTDVAGHHAVGQAQMTVIENTLNTVRVYPNPWRGDRDKTLIFDGLPLGSTLKIFTVSAHSVATLHDNGSGKAIWDLKNGSGESVASGLYLYLITDGQNGKTHGKFAVIR